MKPYAPPNLILDRFWKEKDAKRHKAVVKNMQSNYSQTKMRHASLNIVKGGGKKEGLAEGKYQLSSYHFKLQIASLKSKERTRNSFRRWATSWLRIPFTPQVQVSKFKGNNLLNLTIVEREINIKKSLNLNKRKQKLVQITQENEAILKRLQQRKSMYSVNKWTREFENH